MNRTAGTSPQVYARLGGVLYLLTIVLGALEEVAIRGRIFVAGDAAATFANLRAMEGLWRLGIASELFLGFCTIVLTLVLYVLTRPVHRDLALLAVFFSLVAISIETAFSLHLIEALFPLGSASYLQALPPEQLQAMSSMAIRAHSEGFGIALLFFGPFFFITGYLIARSGYLPRVIGILYLIPGVCYMASSFALILAPAFAHRFYFFMAGPAVIGEGALSLWLLIKGVDMEKWNEKLSVPRDV